MRKSLVVLGAVLLCALTASAADEGKFETFLGYNFVVFQPNVDVIPKFHANGGNGQFVYNFSKWFGAVVDVGAVTKGVLSGFPVDTTIANYVAGPRVTWHSDSRFKPFVQVLFGGAYGTTSARVSVLPSIAGVLPPGIILNPNVPVTARIHASDTAFAMMAGGGLDIKLSKHVAFRPIGADYYLTRFSSPQLGDSNQNNFRYSAGINFLFGAQ